MGAQGAVFSLKIQASKAVTVGYEHQQYSFFLMALLIPAIVVLGFSTTINQNLIHPAIRRPFILYVQAAVFSGCLLFFSYRSL